MISGADSSLQTHPGVPTGCPSQTERSNCWLQTSEPLLRSLLPRTTSLSHQVRKCCFCLVLTIGERIHLQTYRPSPEDILLASRSIRPMDYGLPTTITRS